MTARARDLAIVIRTMIVLDFNDATAKSADKAINNSLPSYGARKIAGKLPFSRCARTSAGSARSCDTAIAQINCVARSITLVVVDNNDSR